MVLTQILEPAWLVVKGSQHDDFRTLHHFLRNQGPLNPETVQLFAEESIATKPPVFLAKYSARVEKGFCPLVRA